jgi:hypothetical protein
MPYLGECPKSGEGKLDAWINRRVLQELRWFWNMSDEDIFEAVKRECRDVEEIKRNWNTTSGMPFKRDVFTSPRHGLAKPTI